jgi:hypothetical protein
MYLIRPESLRVEGHGPGFLYLYVCNTSIKYQNRKVQTDHDERVMGD